MASKSQLIYLRILKAAENITSLTSSSAVSCTTHNPSSPDVDLELPPLPPIQTILLNDGISTEVADKLSLIFLRISADLQHRFNASFRNAWAKISMLPRQDLLGSDQDFQRKLADAFRTVYERKISAWTSEIRKSASCRAVSQDASRTNTCSQKGFNHVSSRFLVRDTNLSKFTPHQNYIPVLEAFFAEEQFPSRADKLYLATKAGMTYRQIHVWVCKSSSICSCDI